MIPELLGATQGLQALLSLLQSARHLANYNEMASAVSVVLAQLIEANEVALKGQAEQAALTRRVKDLEDLIHKREKWEAESPMYEATEIATGVFAYVKEPPVKDFQSAKKYCAACFQQQFLSILQQSKADHRTLALTCHECKSKLVFDDYIWAS